MKLSKLLLLAPLALLSCGSPQAKYVSADRETFDALAPILRPLCDEDPSNDPDLSGVNGEGVLLTLHTWELRITEAEKIAR